MAEIVMPRLSDTMEEGTILRWLKHDGEHVQRGEELVEIETDKAAMIYESDEEGVLRIVAAAGDTLPVGATIAHVGETADPGGAPSAQTTAATGGAPPAETTADHGGAPPAETTADRGGAPPAETTAAPGGAPPVEPGRTAPARVPAGQTPPDSAHVETAQAPGPQPGATEPPSAAPSSGEARDSERVKASPVARRVARERGLDLHGMAGSGPGGRIVKGDVEAAAAGGPAPPAQSASPAPPQTSAIPSTTPPSTPAPATAPPPSVPAPTLAERVATAKGETTVVELTRTQQTIARRMAESKATIPDFALQMEIDMEACVALRAELKRLSPEEAPTYNDMIVKACALALREHPRANGGYRDGKLLLHSRVNVGIAVATDDALVVPTVFDADLKSLGEIARETRALAERVRAGTITPPELGGGTFTVSNLGMYGVRSFTAIVNPPQAGILSVGSLAPRAVVSTEGSARSGAPRTEGPGEQRGEIVARHTLAVTLACDHRILYGADAARFLARIRELLEEPAALSL